MKGMRIDFIVYSSLFILALLIVKSFRWQLLIALTLRKKAYYKECFFSYLYGLAPGLLTPGRVGEVFRIMPLVRFQKKRLAELFVIDKYIEIISLFMLANFGSYLLKLNKLFIATLSMFIILIILFFAREKWVGILGKMIYKLTRKELDLIFKEVKMKHFIYYLILSVVALFFDVSAFYFIINAMRVLDFGVCLLVFPVMLVAAVLPISISGIGLREAVAIYFLSFFHIPSEVSFNASILIFVIGSIIPAVIGWIIGIYKFSRL